MIYQEILLPEIQFHDTKKYNFLISMNSGLNIGFDCHMIVLPCDVVIRLLLKSQQKIIVMHGYGFTFTEACMR
jgi:pentose-5-phosphate-3-epimerase